MAKRLYRELMNCPSPPGQAPFTDSWYLESDLRMLHAAVVWQLYEGLKRPGQGQARALINVHQAYRQLVREPLLDLTRVALVPRLLTMRLWHERRCDHCRLWYLAPLDSQGSECPGCRLYHRYRRPRCGARLGSRPIGRRRRYCGCARVQATGGDRQKESAGGAWMPAPGDPTEPTPTVVPIDQIEEYGRNPRRERNDAYDRIKQSIASRGFMGSLPITRRPGEPHYVVAEGGNTVLHVLKELYAETQDPRFHAIHCLFEPWCGESEILIAHLIENDVRGDLVFIDRALAVRELRGLLQQEHERSLSGRELAATLRERGYVIDQPTISKMDYAIERLLPVIPVALRAGLGRDQVDRIRKLENRLVQFLEHRRKEAGVIEEARNWFLECLARHEREDWTLAPIEQALISHLAEIGGDDANQVPADLEALARFGQAGRDAPPPLALLAQPGRQRRARANAQAGVPAD